MDKVISADGTAIAYERTGTGRPVVLVSGAFGDHRSVAPVAAALAAGHTVSVYDRRARGESGDTRPYRIEREVEDLAAVLAATGPDAAVLGFSSGALLALHAAAVLPVTALVLYEAPFGVDGDAGLPGRLQELMSAGRPGDAVALFQAEGIGLPPETIERLRSSPMWPALEAMAQSTVYDATLAVAPAGPPPGVPSLVLTGERTWPVLAAAAERLAAWLPDATRAAVPGGADHDLPAEATAVLVREFLTMK